MDLKKKLEKKKARIEEKLALIDEIPDLTEYTDRWGQKYLSSPSVNSKVDSVWFNHNCGCCADSPLQVWPYLEHNGQKIHSSPACIVVGWRYAGGDGDEPAEDWQDRLKKEGLPDIIVQKVAKYFEENPPVDEEDEDD
jgi:hypothetical protein